MSTPSAPKASAASSPLPSTMPPAAITGTESTRAALLMSTVEATSAMPRCPPPSNPTMTTASAPTCSAFLAKRTWVILWMRGTPAALVSPMKGSGERPAVSNAATFSSMPMRTISSVCSPGDTSGSIEILMPKGPSVRSRARLTSLRRASVDSKEADGRKPRPPASATAATISANDTQCIPPMRMGYLILSISVIRVFIITPPVDDAGAWSMQYMVANPPGLT